MSVGGVSFRFARCTFTVAVIAILGLTINRMSLLGLSDCFPVGVFSPSNLLPLAVRLAGAESDLVFPVFGRHRKSVSASIRRKRSITEGEKAAKPHNSLILELASGISSDAER